MNRRLDLLLAVLDHPDNVPRLLDGDALLERNLLAHGRRGGRCHRTENEPLERYLPLDQFLLQDFDHGFQLVLILALEQDLVLLLLELDIGVRVLQVIALLNILQRLLNGVIDLGDFDFGDDVEAVVGHKNG